MSVGILQALHSDGVWHSVLRFCFNFFQLTITSYFCNTSDSPRDSDVFDCHLRNLSSCTNTVLDYSCIV